MCVRVCVYMYIINKHSTQICDNICKSGIWGCKKKLNIENIIFKVVQMTFLAMHITNQKLCFDIFTVQNIFMEHDLNI